MNSKTYVYVLECDFGYDGSCVSGVFSSVENAMNYAGEGQAWESKSDEKFEWYSRPISDLGAVYAVETITQMELDEVR